MPYLVSLPAPPPMVQALPVEEFKSVSSVSPGAPTLIPNHQFSPDPAVSQGGLTAAHSSFKNTPKTLLPQVHTADPPAITLSSQFQLSQTSPAAARSPLPLPQLQQTPQPATRAGVLGGPIRADAPSSQTNVPQMAPGGTRGDQDYPLNLGGNLFPILSELAQATPQQVPVTPTPIPDATAPDRQILVIPSHESPTNPSTRPPVNSSAPSPANPVPEPAESPTPTTPSGVGEPVELRADRQDYDNIRQVFTAEGNVEMRFRQAVLNADRVQVNLQNRIAVAAGNVVLRRGDQVLLGDRFEYNFVQEAGTVLNARGEVFLPSADNDLAPTLPTDVTAGSRADRPLSDVLANNQPVTSGQGIEVGVGQRVNQPAGQAQGELRRVRFEAEQIEFNALGWVATNVRLTNDPFSPPELEVRSPRVRFTRLSPTRSEIVARNPRLVIDQNTSIPLVRERVILDRRRRDPSLVQFAYDDDLGGFYVQRSLEVLNSPAVRLTVTPQILVQRIISDNGGNPFDGSNFGLVTRLQADLSPRTTLRGTAAFTSLDLSDVEDNLRASLRLQQQIGTALGTHSLALEASYRNQLFNGSLGFQNVQSSIGFVFTSPVIPLGRSGINLSYQAGAQYITADTDRLDLLAPIRENNRIGLTRVQTSAALSRFFPLWRGEALPATREEGLRFSSRPVVPSLSLGVGVLGVNSLYSNGDNQASLTGTVSLAGQFGNFARNTLDFTGFNVTLSQTLLSGSSPFLFDRVVDQQVLSAGVLQQVYGPFRVGFQTSLSLNRGETIDTEYILDYSRRTFSITLRYNPVRQLGSLTFRVSDFNWGGVRNRFDDTPGRSTVETGVER
jgi:hypothetical protein